MSKVTNITPSAFKPVVITLESQAEVEALLAVLSRISGGGSREITSAIRGELQNFSSKTPEDREEIISGSLHFLD